MNYIEEGKKPPKCKSVISTPEELVEALRPLIGQAIPMTGKSRTDGSNFRKIVTNHLLSNYMPEAADEYEIVPPKQKGVPAFLREYIDTYIVTTGNSYNLQVWNRNPNSASVQVDLKNGETLLASDVRFVLGKIDTDNCIESIIVMTPDYIENRFGKFGKPTVKQQLIISNKKREDIIRDGGMVIADSNLPQELLASGDEIINADVSIKDEPHKVLPIEIIDERITNSLIGEKLDISLSTKQRGQQLERMVAYQLGYSGKQDSLEGGYPDIRKTSGMEGEEDKQEREKKIFSLYYINTEKVYEIAMLLNNRIVTSGTSENESESTLEKQTNIGINSNLKYLESVKGELGLSQNIQIHNGIKSKVLENFDVKTTKSNMLASIIAKANVYEGNENINLGALILLKNASLVLLNAEESYAVTKMILNGAFKNTKISSNSDDMKIEFDLSAMINSLLKDCAYELGCIVGDKKFLLTIPMTFENDFENSYNIYDLQVGTVNKVCISPT